MIPASAALARLRQGNARFVQSQAEGRCLSITAPGEQLIGGQEPFAIILGCSDSRVPAELVFDQGFGDLFVIRVAGNIVAPSQVGSVEFAASRFGTRLVVVLGHSQCGAVGAALDELQGIATTESRNLRSIVDRVRPSLETLVEMPGKPDRETLISEGVRANVRASADHLRHGSELLEKLIQSDGLLIVGAVYSLETGLVEFFDGADGSTKSR
ncbi:MAG TPA: carbonic anhydrase [Chthoniobacterales bacterium]|nr:carbonic anhydrase [Chthoniobacterales bacterium]